MTDERAIIKLGLNTGAGSSHEKSPFMTLWVDSRPLVDERLVQAKISQLFATTNMPRQHFYYCSGDVKKQLFIAFVRDMCGSWVKYSEHVFHKSSEWGVWLTEACNDRFHPPDTLTTRRALKQENTRISRIIIFYQRTTYSYNSNV